MAAVKAKALELLPCPCAQAGWGQEGEGNLPCCVSSMEGCQGGTHWAGEGLGFLVCCLRSRVSHPDSTSWLSSSKQPVCLATLWSCQLSWDPPGALSWCLGSPCSPQARFGGTDPLWLQAEGKLPLLPSPGPASPALELRHPNSSLHRPRIPVTLNMKMVMPSWSVPWVAGVPGTLLGVYFGE